MKIMFLRESNGVYQFGHKKVHLKIEKGGQIFVRVGGGFLHVREFLNEYTSPELEKLNRTDVLTKFQTKVIVQNIVQQRADNAIETLPLFNHNGKIMSVSSNAARRDSNGNKVSSSDSSQKAIEAREGAAGAPASAELATDKLISHNN